MSVIPPALAACVRGEITLADACGVDRASLAAARTLAYLCSKQGREDLARTILEGCVALDDRDPETFRALAALSLRLGDAARARVAAERALGIEREPEAGLLFARSLVALGAWTDARAWLQYVVAEGKDTTARTASALLRRLESL